MIELFLLDTNVISEGMRPKPDVKVMNWLARANPKSVFLSSIVKAELLFGIEILAEGKRRANYSNYVQEFFERCPSTNFLNFGESEAALFAKIATRRKVAGRPISEMDGLIAATAAAKGFAIVTRNVSDFEECGIEVFNPWETAS